MKLFYQLIILSLFSLFSFAQNNSRTAHYVLDDFYEGTILMKDGTRQAEFLNYNSLSKNFAVLRDEKIAAISENNINSIDTVYVANRRFFRKDNTFFELLIKSDIELYVEHKCNLMSASESSGYGGESQVTSGQSRTLVGNNDIFYDTELPSKYKVNPIKEYWIKKDDALKKIETMGQLKKFYKEQKKNIKTYKKRIR
ncbi:hypothetical protein [Winogradskyella sp.]|uniref:hypothetical protein n=1 Tax=Winogradskyella sp. TaxID=1883156 RepID=UPI003F6AABD7